MEPSDQTRSPHHSTFSRSNLPPPPPPPLGQVTSDLLVDEDGQGLPLDSSMINSTIAGFDMSAVPVTPAKPPAPSNLVDFDDNLIQKATLEDIMSSESKQMLDTTPSDLANRTFEVDKGSVDKTDQVPDLDEGINQPLGLPTSDQPLFDLHPTGEASSESFLLESQLPPHPPMADVSKYQLPSDPFESTKKQVFQEDDDYEFIGSSKDIPSRGNADESNLLNYQASPTPSPVFDPHQLEEEVVQVKHVEDISQVLSRDSPSQIGQPKQSESQLKEKKTATHEPTASPHPPSPPASAQALSEAQSRVNTSQLSDLDELVQPRQSKPVESVLETSRHEKSEPASVVKPVESLGDHLSSLLSESKAESTKVVTAKANEAAAATTTTKVGVESQATAIGVAAVGVGVEAPTATSKTGASIGAASFAPPAPTAAPADSFLCQSSLPEPQPANPGPQLNKEPLRRDTTHTSPASMSTESTASVSSSSCSSCPFALGTWLSREGLHPVVADLVFWKDPKKSGVTFAAGLIILLSLVCCSVISVVAYTCLAVLTGTLSFRIYKNILQAVQKTNEGHPFKEYLEYEISPSNERVHQAVDVLLKHATAVVLKLRSVFLVEDIVDSIKFVILFWCLTYIGSWFNGLTLIILAYLAAFSLPKVYETNKAQIDQTLQLACKQIQQTVDTVKSKIPFPQKDKKQ